MAEDPPEADNTISGGVFLGPAVQGRYVQAMFQLAVPPPTALAQLPAETAAFTGREEDLAVVSGLLSPAGTVLVSEVSGLAGVGKTTLAVHAAHAAVRSGWFPGGSLFIDLHGYDDSPVQPGQALDSILRALGVPPEHVPPSAEDRPALYRSVLAQIIEPVLVVVDNASSEAQVRPLLPGTGPHKVLVTSRDTLAGLGARLVDVAVLDDEASVKLLERALRATRPGDDRITGDHDGAMQLAEACGGLPLALQITAALLVVDTSLTASEIALQLRDETQRLEKLRYDDGSGGLSVAAAFSLSYRRLDKTAARVFRLLAVAPGPDASASAVAVMAGLPEARARQLLGGLAGAHLIESSPAGAGRWRMHDLVRLYARQQSDQRARADRRDRAVDRLLDYWLDTADAADDHLRALPGSSRPGVFANREEALAWFDGERASLVAAIRLAAATGRDRIVMRLPFHLAHYLSWRRRFDDEIEITQLSVDACRRGGYGRNAAIALGNLGDALRQARRYEEAIAASRDAAAIQREMGDRHSEGLALANLGATMQELRRYSDAIAADQDAAAIFRETGDRNSEGKVLDNLGGALQGLRCYSDAITAHEDAAAIFRETGDRNSEGAALSNLGSALLTSRRYGEAITACRDAVAIFRETGDRYGEGKALTSLGGALQEMRRYGEAITACRDAVTIFRETGDRYGEGSALIYLGDALKQARRYRKAIAAHQDAAAIFREIGDEHMEAVVRANLDALTAWPHRFSVLRPFRRIIQLLLPP